ncbi:MAG: NAD(+) diphosphatase [Ruminiclostridium sp.]|nr:NAD(+) diphosphatase [Ruminiclostridium sp.]
MLHEIAPKQYHVEFAKKQPGDNAICFVFKGPEILEKMVDDVLLPPTYGEIKEKVEKYIYLFAIDDTEYYLADLKEEDIPEGYGWWIVRNAPEHRAQDQHFAEYTAYQLYVWYRDNQFCGRCGTHTEADGSLRMLRCPKCGNMIFPRITPAIMVAVTHEDKILVTRYKGRAYKGYAMIAGFNEIGETAEETVRREVLEEVGLHVSEVKYYKSQPWGIDGNLMLGYFAKLDGSNEIDLDRQELAQAAWLKRDELDDDTIRYQYSLAGDLVAAFRRGENE